MISITNQIELRHLLYFKVLSEELHYGKAAEKLFISQSALSQQMKQLEGILGHTVFERTNKKVLLNEAGLRFQADIQQVLLKLEMALDNQSKLQIGNTGQLTIGFVASAMQSILPHLLKRFNHDCPNIQFNLEELTNKEQLVALQNGNLDLGFMRTNQVSRDFKIKKVYTEPFSLILPEDHWLNDTNFKNVGQLSEESFILFPNDQSTLYYQQIINICAEQRFFPRIVHRSIHAPTIFKLVENKMGISILPMSLCTPHPGVRFIKLEGVLQKTELFAVWPKQNNNPALPFLIEMLDSIA
ncbi:LysR substrate-binding domain-containing protein [Pinibacter aurantiacus]|uniref:LysR family transcriptional regulator n=1 Tax=Pinibacter aurantiacus TaxID=2851599 RepID=A0A9E2W5H5_9BACT|nr:LysR substrate-binding domain-containing protein [Pinibacter aurantiacus]MBV4358894.1 LysR family transcriptional regulator [Pinibacter aurantiacus]